MYEVISAISPEYVLYHTDRGHYCQWLDCEKSIESP